MADILDLFVAELVADGIDRDRARNAADRLRQRSGGSRHYVRQAKAARTQAQVVDACRLHSVPDAAAICHVSTRTVYRYRTKHLT